MKGLSSSATAAAFEKEGLQFREFLLRHRTVQSNADSLCERGAHACEDRYSARDLLMHKVVRLLWMKSLRIDRRLAPN